MKKLFATFLFFMMIFSIYYDLKIGTLPQNALATNPQLVDQRAPETSIIPSESVVVEAGYTVLSIVEELHNGPINATIQQIINDFEALNPGSKSSKINIGKSYLFPVYYE